MRSFVGDEPFEPVGPPPRPAVAPAAPIAEPASVHIGLTLFKAADMAAGAAGSFQEKGDSGNLLPLFRAVWSVIPEAGRRPLRVVFRTVAVLVGGLIVAIAALTAR